MNVFMYTSILYMHAWWGKYLDVYPLEPVAQLAGIDEMLVMLT